MASILSFMSHPTNPYEPIPRFSHGAAAVGGRCYLWGGCVQDITESGRRNLPLTIEIFDPYLEAWKKHSTTGVPPPGLYQRASTSLLDSLYSFGGSDDSSFYNSLHTLDTTSLEWREVRPLNPADGPMSKVWCGIVSYFKDQLAIFGGYGIPKGPSQPGSTFVKDHFISETGWTNELHVFDITTSKWSSPPTTGPRPSPCYLFSFTAVNNHQAVLFGGNQPGHHKVDDCFLMNFESMEWTKLEKPKGAPWPAGRDSHAACCLNYGEEHPQLLVTGGVDKNGNTLSDAWILDINSERWSELTFHEAGQPRLRHTTTALSLRPGWTRVIMFGGCPKWEWKWEWDKSHNAQQKLAKTTVLEFESVQSSSSSTSEWALVGEIHSSGLGTPERLTKLEEMQQRKTEHVFPPEIIRHPENQSVVTGVDIDFNIQATGDNLQFQWQKDGSDLSESGKYCGANTDTLHIIKMEEDDKGRYRCIVKNDVEMKFSDEALLTVNIDHYLSICEQVIHEHGKMDQTIMHCIFLGAAGVGKSSLMKRLLRLKLDAIRTSTQIAEKSIRVEVRDVKTAVAEVSGLDWQIIDDPSTQACGLIGQMFTRQEKESEKEHQLTVGEANIHVQAPEQRQVKNTQKQASELNGKMSTKKGVASELASEKIEERSTQGRGHIGHIKQWKGEDQITSEHTTSKSQTLHFSKIDFFRDVLDKRGLSGLKQHINNPWTLYLTDSGGQPEFQELLPALAVCPCVFFVVFPLDKDMMKEYKVQYMRPDEQKCMKIYTSSFNLQDDIMQSLASIAATKYEDKDGKEVKPRVLLVATFIDKVPQEDRQTKLDYIEALVKETDVYHQDMVIFASETQMVFTINNLSEEAENDAQKIRDAFQKIAKHFVVPTPYPWLIFGILVQHEYENDSVICTKKCFELAQECGIHSKREFEAALQFLHKQTGLLHYYQEPFELRQIVIRNPQHLFNRVNCLVEKTFIFEETPSGKCIADFKKGIFKREDYISLTEDSSSSKLTSDMLLKLLEHLKVVVPLGDSKTKYFMPCAIAHLDKASPAQPATIDQSCCSDVTIPPLLMTFMSGYCPKGLFGALVACIANKQVANCTLNLDEAKINRDQIRFTMGQYDLLLRVNPNYIYIEIIPDKSDTPLSILCTQCNSVRNLILENIRIACEALHYSDDANGRLSFECNQCGELEKFHPAVLRKDLNHCFWCIRAKKVIDVRKECYMWLPQPTILEMVPKEQSVAPGMEANFQVKATGDCLEFKWKKDSKDLHDGVNYCGTQTHTLRIKDVKKSDKGGYQCLVKNNYGNKLSNEAKLTVIDPPKITRHLETKSVTIGSCTTFTVEATGDDLQFLWQKDGKDIDKNESRLHCSQTDDTSTLCIQYVKKSDQGHYRCLVKNLVEETSYEAGLTVFDPPKITQHPESQSVVTGTIITFTVEATGDDLQFLWQKDGKNIDRNVSQLQCSQTDNTSTLHIQHVKKSDQGHYRCLVKNLVEETSYEAELTVFDPPKIIQHPESQSVVTGTTIAFTVEATGDDLQFLWQKGGKDIDRNGSRLHCSQTDNTSTLHIQHVKKSDQGHYRCLVKNLVEESRTNSDVAKLIVSHNWKKTGIIFIAILVLLVLFATNSGIRLASLVVDCGTLTNPVNGQVSHTARTTFGETATYSCDPGYTLVGGSTRTCQATGIWSGNAPTCQHKLYPSDHESEFKHDSHPTLDVLRLFPVKGSFIDIAKKIATDYKLFGTQLLKDSDGSKVRIVEMKHGDPVDITAEILEQWLQGKGRMPITWQTLIECLRDTDLHVLANTMESSLSEHNGSKESDKVPSKEL